VINDKVLNGTQIRERHLPHEIFEPDFTFPPQKLLGLGTVSEQEVDFSGAYATSA
jgi:hypothetical protein